MHEYALVCIGIYRYASVSYGIHEYALVFISIYRYALVSYGMHEYALVYTGMFWYISTNEVKIQISTRIKLNIFGMQVGSF